MVKGEVEGVREVEVGVAGVGVGGVEVDVVEVRVEVVVERGVVVVSNLIIKRFKGFPPLRLFVYNNWCTGREDHDEFVKEGAKLIGTAWIDGWSMYSVFANNSVVLKELNNSTVNGELYAMTQRGLMWCDARATLGTDRVNLHVHYEVPERTELPTGGFMIERNHGIKGIETAWVHFFARPLPFAAKQLNSIYELNDLSDNLGVCC